MTTGIALFILSAAFLYVIGADRWPLWLLAGVVCALAVVSMSVGRHVERS